MDSLTFSINIYMNQSPSIAKVIIKRYKKLLIVWMKLHKNSISYKSFSILPASWGKDGKIVCKMECTFNLELNPNFCNLNERIEHFLLLHKVCGSNYLITGTASHLLWE